MELFSRFFEWLSGLLVALGVPSESSGLAAMVLLYIAGIMAVMLVILFLLRRRKGGELPSPVPPVEKEVPIVTGKPFPPETTVADAAAEEQVVEEQAEEEPVVVSAAPPVPSAAPPVPEPAAPIPAAAPAVSLFERMRAGLAKTQSALVGRIDSLLGGRQTVDADLLEELEEILITADFGMKTTQDLVQSLNKRYAGGNAAAAGLRDLLKEEIRQRLRLEAAPLDLAASSPFVIMVVGVNGVGKTTTIGKLARQFAGQGKRVVLGAGDTFRAAAAEQLAIWGERAGVEVVRHSEGADPAAVAFDAAKAAVARGADVLILDTAGRLHTKVNLMEELKKVRRVLAREIPGAPHETLLVLDATTGQNALVQARLFREAVDVSGIALTKLDGTAKGGVVVAIGAELGVPVRFVGIGEGVDDLRPFDPDLFVEALFQRNV